MGLALIHPFCLLVFVSSSDTDEPLRRSHVILSKEGIKYKSNALHGPDEPLNFCKSASSGQKFMNLDCGAWPVRNSSVRTGHGVDLQPAARKYAHYGKPYRPGPGYCGNRVDAFVPKTYGSAAHNNYGADAIKSENFGYEGHGEGYDAHVMPEPPIKVEQDSDSENGCDIYGRYQSGYDSVQMKAEAAYGEQFSCQRLKGMAYGSHYHNAYGGAAQPLKCVLNRDAAASSSLNSHCVDAYAADYKGYVQNDYKVGYEFKGHGILHCIKQEPADPPHWNMMTNSVMSGGANKINPYVFMQ